MIEVNNIENSISTDDSFHSNSGIDEKTFKYPVICKDCQSILKIKDFDFKNNKYNMTCVNGHSLNYVSYDMFTELKNADSSKSSRKASPNRKSPKCDSDKEELNHDKIESTKFQDDESKDLKAISESIESIRKALNDWKKTINKKIDNYLNVIDNYYKTHETIYKYYKKNTQAFEKENILKSNHKIFQDNIMNVNNYLTETIKAIKDIKKDDFENENSSFAKIFEDFDKEKIFSLQEIKAKKAEQTEEENINTRIFDMDKMKISLKSEVKSFCPLNKGKYMLFGLQTGEIEMYAPENISHFKFKISMKVFEQQVQHICELDEDLIAATDGKTRIKIIQFVDNFSNYQIVQSLPLKGDSDYVYSMIPLPLLSAKKKSHYFCTGDDKHILIFKSNSKPKYLTKEENDNKEISFELIKDIKVNSLIHCLIEANEDYIFAACTDINKIKIFDVTNDFREVASINGYDSSNKFELSKGSNIFAVIPKTNILIIGCDGGFILINTKKIKMYKRIFCKYKVLCLDMLSNNSIVCCTSDKKGNRIKQYALDENCNFSKISERNIKNNYEIWKLQKSNQKIFFIDNESKLNYVVHTS